jgi:hypothetical protein
MRGFVSLPQSLPLKKAYSDGGERKRRYPNSSVGGSPREFVLGGLGLFNLRLQPCHYPRDLRCGPSSAAARGWYAALIEGAGHSRARCNAASRPALRLCLALPALDAVLGQSENEPEFGWRGPILLDQTLLEVIVEKDTRHFRRIILPVTIDELHCAAIAIFQPTFAFGVQHDVAAFVSQAFQDLG